MSPATDDLARVRRTWAYRTVTEYRSAAVCAELLHASIVLGLSPDTLGTLHRIVAEELRHAELCREILLAAGGATEPLPLPRDALSLLAGRPPADLERGVLEVVMGELCAGETGALALFRALREAATIPTVVTILEEILRDEARHRSFAWELLDELLERSGEEGRRHLSEHLPAELLRWEKMTTSRDVPVRPEEAAWGLIDPRRQMDIAHGAFRGEVVERLGERGIGIGMRL